MTYTKSFSIQFPGASGIKEKSSLQGWKALKPLAFSVSANPNDSELAAREPII